MTRLWFAAALGVIVLASAPPAVAGHSEGFRCPDTDKLIELGNSTYDVRSAAAIPIPRNSARSTH